MKNFLAFVRRHLTAFVVGGSCVGSVIISEIFYVHQSIRLDESQSLWQTSHSYGGILHAVALDVHVPLYHIILHTWQLFFGQSIESVRTVSLLFFVISIPVLYKLALLVIRRPWALCAVVLYSFSPFILWYANEARMYTLLVLVAIFSQYYFVRIIQGKRGWLGYVVSAMVGVYVHYFFIFNLIVQGLYFLFNRRTFAKGTLLRISALAALLVLELAPWLYYFHELGSASSTSPHLAKPSTVDFFNALSQFAFGFQTDSVNTIMLSLWPALMIGALLLVRSRIKPSPSINYLLMAGVLPVILAFFVSVTVRPFFISRYMISCVPALIICLMWALQTYPQYLRRIVAAGLLALLVVTSVLQVNSPMTPVKENYRAAAQYITDKATPSDLVILSAPFTVYPFENAYGFGPAQIRTLPNWYGQVTEGIPAFDASSLPSDVSDMTDGHRNAYVLFSFDQGYEKDIKDYFDSHYAFVERQQFSDDLILYVYHVHDNNAQSLSHLDDNKKIQPIKKL